MMISVNPNAQSLVTPASYKEWKFCPVCAHALTESKLLAKDPDGFISFEVACKAGHTFVLTESPRRREIRLTAWAPQYDQPKQATAAA